MATWNMDIAITANNRSLLNQQMLHTLTGTCAAYSLPLREY